MLISLTEIEGGAFTPIAYEIGTLVKHKLYGYRGVIVSYDSCCEACDKWYFGNKTQPDRNQPWYNVLMHDSGGLSCYVAQSNLSFDPCAAPIEHPRVSCYFTRFENGVYIPKQDSSDCCSG